MTAYHDIDLYLNTFFNPQKNPLYLNLEHCQIYTTRLYCITNNCYDEQPAD